MSQSQLPGQPVEARYTLGRLSRSLAANLHSDYSNLLIELKSMWGSGGRAESSNDYNRKKVLILWVKGKMSIINEFRGIIKVAYDANLYSIINTVHEKMFRRRQQIICAVEQTRALANFLNQIKLPIYAVEEALQIIKDGRKSIEQYKLDYLLKIKKSESEYEDLENIVANKDTQKDQDQEKSQTGVFENIGFWIDKYFHSHYYLGERAVWRIGNLAEIVLLYRPKDQVKFVILKISLIKSFEIFVISSDSKQIITKLQIDLNKLAFKINEKVKKDFTITEEDLNSNPYSEQIRNFEAYEEHEKEHQQISRILKYVKKFFNTLIIQILYDKFALKKRTDNRYTRTQTLKDIKFDFQNMVITVTTGMCWSNHNYIDFNIPVLKRRSRYGFNKNKNQLNILKFKWESIKESSNASLPRVAIKISTIYNNNESKCDEGFYFIESINHSEDYNQDLLMDLNQDSTKSFEMTEEWVNWAESYMLDLEIDSWSPNNIIDTLLNKATKTSLYLYGVKLAKTWKLFDPYERIVQIKITGKINGSEICNIKQDFDISVTMILYEHLNVTFNWSTSTGKLYIQNSSFLSQDQINCLNMVVSQFELKAKEIKALVQLLWMEYIFTTLDQKLKESWLHVVKSDKLVFHFQMKKLRVSRINSQISNFWNYFWKIMKLEPNITQKLKRLFYGNSIYVFLNPFDSHVVLPIFNPISIIKTDKTYNFITVEILSDLLHKFSDIELNFVWGRVTDNEDWMIEEIKNRILFDKDLNLNLNQLISSHEIQHNAICNLAKEIIIYYKNNDQLKCLYTLMSRLWRTKFITRDSKRLILLDLNFDFNPDSKDANFSPNNEFKVLNVFQGIFQSTKLEIRNEWKTWIFNITNEETIATLSCLKEVLNLKYFKNFLIDIDVSLIIDLENKLIVITHERSTKYKTFTELARQIAKLFEIIKYLDIHNNQKMLKYLKHYKSGKNKSMLIFQIPLTKGVHLNTNIEAVSFVIGYSINYEVYNRAADNTKYGKNGQKSMQKAESQTSSSLNVQVYPNFSQSFLLCSLKRDISNVGAILESLENSADSLVEFNEYITMGRIIYPSIMDGEDKYNVTFVSRSKDEISIFYRDYFALDIVFPSEPKSTAFCFHIYDKANSWFYTDKEDAQTNIIPIPYFKHLKIKIGKTFS